MRDIDILKDDIDTFCIREYGKEILNDIETVYKC